MKKGAAKTSGGSGWADVAKLGYFDWEYKAKKADLENPTNNYYAIAMRFTTRPF